MLLKASDRRRVIELQWSAKNTEIEKLLDWLLDETEDFNRNKFTKIINIAEKMQNIAENCKRQRGMKGRK